MGPVLLRQLTIVLTGCIAVLMTASCSKTSTSPGPVPPASARLVFKGEGFAHDGHYPKRYTCDSAGISPALSWESVPANARGFAITMHHYPPTGDKHVYWVVYNIPFDVRSLPAGQPGSFSFGINTVNSRNLYAPPCSQGPGAKVYILTLYALSAQPVIAKPAPQVTMDVLLDAIWATKLDTAVMSVTYTR